MLLFISFRIFSMCTFNVFKKLFATILIIVKFIRKTFLLHIDTYTIKYHNQTYFYIWKLGFHFPRQNHHLSNKINDALQWLFQGNNFNIIILVNALFTMSFRFQKWAKMFLKIIRYRIEPKKKSTLIPVDDLFQVPQIEIFGHIFLYYLLK